jgi:hypothetical protein
MCHLSVSLCSFSPFSGFAIIAEHSFWLYISAARETVLSAFKASTNKYKKLHIGAGVAHSIQETFGHPPITVSHLYSKAVYHSTSEQLIQIALKHLLCMLGSECCVCVFF